MHDVHLKGIAAPHPRHVAVTDAARKGQAAAPAHGMCVCYELRKPGLRNVVKIHTV